MKKFIAVLAAAASLVAAAPAGAAAGQGVWGGNVQAPAPSARACFPAGRLVIIRGGSCELASDLAALARPGEPLVVKVDGKLFFDVPVVESGIHYYYFQSAGRLWNKIAAAVA